MLQPTDAAILDNLGERLRQAINADRRLADPSGNALTVSVSIGGHLSRIGEQLDSVLLHGDQALYAAKAAGRNGYRSSAALAVAHQA
jgi:GGDEF domain-containing protein